MKPIYLVFDTGCTAHFEPTTDRTVAQSFFNEIRHDDKEAVMIVRYDDERPEDLTLEATEAAAQDWLASMGDDDLPQWVYRTDAYDSWLEQGAYAAADARTEWNHHKALRANM